MTKNDAGPAKRRQRPAVNQAKVSQMTPDRIAAEDRLLATRMTESVNRLTKLRADLAELKTDLAASNDTIERLRGAWLRFNEFWDGLGIESILLAHVPPQKLWMLDRWLGAIRQIEDAADVWPA